MLEAPVSDDPPSSKKTGPPAPLDQNERPTVSPPFDVEAFARATANRESSEGGTGERITLTNEVELEMARARSAKGSDAPRTRSSGALSIANARAPSTPSPAPRLPTAAPQGQAPTNIEAAVLDAVAGSGPDLDIVERSIDDPAAEMRERFSLGDYTGALEMAELILADDPGNLEAAEFGENCRRVLEKMFAAKIGSLDRVPIIIVPRTQMRWLSIDHRAGFILSLVDGTSSVEMILDVSGMPRLDALRILQELVQQRIVSLR
jgi:hypothetical protein